MKSVLENKLEPKKNSQQNLDYYKTLEEFYDNDPCSSLLKIRSFALYTPRQVLTDYLVRYELFKQIVDIPGSIFEFGVFNGQGLMSFANFSAIAEPYNTSRRIFGFDTFQGFASVSMEDQKNNSSFVAEGNYDIDSYTRINHSIELFNTNRSVGHIPKVELINGDVCETLPKFLEENPHVIASLIYLDMDIYRPTKTVLEMLLSRVPKGGVIVFDELNMKDFPGETVALMEVLNLNKIALRRLPFCSRISYFVME